MDQRIVRAWPKVCERLKTLMLRTSTDIQVASLSVQALLRLLDLLQQQLDETCLSVVSEPLLTIDDVDGGIEVCWTGRALLFVSPWGTFTLYATENDERPELEDGQVDEATTWLISRFCTRIE